MRQNNLSDLSFELKIHRARRGGVGAGCNRHRRPTKGGHRCGGDRRISKHNIMKMVRRIERTMNKKITNQGYQDFLDGNY